jgi:hypothetical protein
MGSALATFERIESWYTPGSEQQLLQGAQPVGAEAAYGA